MSLRTPIQTRDITERDRQLIREELETVTHSSHFASSKRYPAFLSYVVEQTLAGRASDLKERTIGVEVFHRKPDFDSNSDTVVRFTAGEVRRRLTTVYHESVQERPIHIELPVGSYVPEFFRISEDTPPLELAPAATILPLEVSPAEKRTPRQASGYLAVAVVVAALIASVAGVREWRSQHDFLAAFWRPVVSAHGPVLLTPGAMVFSPTAESNVTKAQKTDPYPYISVSTARALSNVVAMFSSEKTSYQIQPTSEISLTEMRDHPVVLIGAYSNEWTIRLLNGLRYRMTEQPQMEIYDSLNPSHRWARPARVAYQEADDYAIVARYRDKLTDNFVVVAGGIGKNGTEAAAQFITSSRYLEMLDSRSKDWAEKNLECVLRIVVIDGKAGPPSLEAVYTW